MPSNSVAEAARGRASLALMLASGFAGLGYQVVWTQQCALWLGHDSAAVLAVLAAFFGGLAVGALLAGPRIERSAHPVRWYAACELAIGLWGLVLAGGMRPFSGWLPALMGPEPSAGWQWTIAFSGTFLLLLPATAAMGATLPAMERAAATLGAAGRSIAAFYAANTFGAVLGVLAAAAWLVPELGLTRTALVCVALNLLCAGLALWALPQNAEALPDRPEPTLKRQLRALTPLAFTGFLGIGYEVLVVRVLSQVAEDTVYTYALLLAVYLVGTALGAALYQRLEGSEKWADRLPAAQTAACLVGTASLWGAEGIRAACLDILGGGMAAALTAEAVLALVAFGLPTVVMGALFSQLSQRANAYGISFGLALGINTLGAMAAPVLFGVWAAPGLGPKRALLLLALGYLALARRAAWTSALAWTPIAFALGLAVWAPPLAFVAVPEGGRIVSYREGIMAAVSVVEDAEGVKRLRINNRQQEGSSATCLVDGRQALLPVLLHPGPREALFLGLGTGIAASSATEDMNLHVDAVELLPEVIAASQHFTQVFEDSAPNPRLRLVAADARRYVRAGQKAYDVIVADNFHPARSGSGALYTVEHFEAVRHRLAPEGLFCQWLPLHQLDLETLRSIVRSFRAVFPGGWAILASNSLETPVLGLVGRGDGGRFDLARLRERLADAAFQNSPAESGIEDEFALLGSFVAGPEALRRYAEGAAANTDDHPVVAYHAPRVTYAPDSRPRDRLLELLRVFAVAPGEVVESPADPAWAPRMAAYWSARDRYLEAGRDVRPSGNARDMLAQVGEPLLAALRLSPDFRPAYDPLLRMARALARTDTAAAESLLRELARIQPARPEAGEALGQLAGAAR